MFLEQILKKYVLLWNPKVRHFSHKRLIILNLICLKIYLLYHIIARNCEYCDELSDAIKGDKCRD